MNDIRRDGEGLPRPRSHPYRRAEDRFELLVDNIQDYAIFMLDPAGRVNTWNRGAEKIKGYRADEIIGRSFEVFYPDEAVRSGWPRYELERAAADGRFEDQGWRLRKDGSRFWANVIITALRTDDGTLRGFAKITRDLTEFKRQQEALRQSEEQVRLLVESVKDYAIFMLDPHGRILSWNAGAAGIHGHAAGEVLNRHFSLLFTPDDRQAGRPAKELARALNEGHAEDQGWRLRKDGSVFWAHVVLTPVTDSQGKLRGFAKVTRDLSEQRRLTELEHATRRMNEFIAMLAHELRNPLAPIRNAVSIMQLQRDLAPELQQTRDIIARQISHLTRLVDDLLDVGRIVTGKILLKSERIDYRDVVQASIEAASPAIAARGHRLHVSVPAEPLQMTGDATRLAQALQNLLSNAARYTPEGGEITLAVQHDDSAVVTTVSDNGIGISADAMERIFELFAQEASSRAPNEGGLGIGLSLARTLTEQHGGMLSAHSRGPGQGSTFTLRLPLRRDMTLGAAPPPPAAVPDLGERRRRVLVVDDNRDSADTMVQLLGLMGHEARACYGGSAALQTADDAAPQVVLLDLNMPDSDGYSVLQALRARRDGPDLFIAAMTGYGQQADRDSTLAAGFDAHLTKPVDVTQLREVLRQASEPKAAPG